MSPETRAQILALIASQDGLCSRCRRRDVTNCEIGWVECDDDHNKVGVWCDWCGFEAARELESQGRWITGGDYGDRIFRSIMLDVADGRITLREPDR